MSIRVPRRLACWAVTAVTAGAATIIGTPAARAAVGGVVAINSDQVSVRSGPRLDYLSYKIKRDGDGVTILCKDVGESVTGPKGTSRVWLMVKSGGFIPDVKVRHAKTPTDCRYAKKPPRANPRTKNQAINWGFKHLGTTAYENLCFNFQARAFGWSHAGFETAEDGGDWMVRHDRMHARGIPPRGALVWYHNSVGSGHVAVSLGRRLVLGTSVNGAVGIAGYKAHDSYRGWTIPFFPRGS